MYHEKVLDKFKNPKHLGKIEDASATADTSNFKCGDIMKIYLKVEDNIIKKVTFETLGCAPAIAVTEMICELAEGKTLEEARTISYKEIAEELGGLPPQKMHCSSMAEKALNMAIDEYEKTL